MKRYPIVVDVDMGLGRRYGYEDLVRLWHTLGVVDRVEMFTPARCHPDRPHTARGMCKPCYQREWKRGSFTRTRIETGERLGSQP